MEDMKKILVVDDDKDLCDLIYQILLDENFIVEQAYNGEKALELISNSNFILIIIDNKLKTMNGLEVIEKARLLRPDMKAIMISAFGTIETKQQAKNLGISDFFDKPFEISKLLDCVKKHIN